jgi:hypothetical protein
MLNFLKNTLPDSLALYQNADIVMKKLLSMIQVKLFSYNMFDFIIRGKVITFDFIIHRNVVIIIIIAVYNLQLLPQYNSFTCCRHDITIAIAAALASFSTFFVRFWFERAIMTHNIFLLSAFRTKEVLSKEGLVC